MVTAGSTPNLEFSLLGAKNTNPSIDVSYVAFLVSTNVKLVILYFSLIIEGYLPTMFGVFKLRRNQPSINIGLSAAAASPTAGASAAGGSSLNLLDKES